MAFFVVAVFVFPVECYSSQATLAPRVAPPCFYLTYTSLPPCHYAMLCYAMLCYAMLCMLCQGIPVGLPYPEGFPPEEDFPSIGWIHKTAHAFVRIMLGAVRYRRSFFSALLGIA